jgi:hypothetical protein
MIKFNSNLRYLVAGRGLTGGFASPSAISIYGGTRPTAAQIVSSWSSYNTSNPNFLAHYLGAVWSNPNNLSIMSLTTIPPAVNALNTGTATWCILWASNVSAVNVAGATLPNTQFIVGDVSEFAGSALVKFTSANFVTGSPNTILTSNINVLAL